MHDPLREIADIDELHRRIRRRGRKDAAALGDTARPVREPVGRVVRADDQPGTHDQRTAGVCLLDDPLAGGLERAVVLEALAVRILELGDAVSLERRDAQVAVHRDARHVDVPFDTSAQCIDRQTHDARDERRDVDYGVPLPSGEGVQALCPIAADLLDVGKQAGIGLAAIEQRQLVVARERSLDDRAPDELRAA